MRKKYIFLLVFIIFNTELFAQSKKDSIPLLFFLQANFDSTIILQAESNWYPGPNYEIICNRNKELYAFTYKNPFSNFKGFGLPKSLQNKFLQQYLKMEMSPADTNAYFLPISFKYQQEPVVIRSLQDLHLWNIVGDEVEGEGCNKCAIHDSIYYIIYLIIKDGIKKLRFYDPKYFEGCCPGSKNRQTAIQLVKIMNNVFR